MDRMAKTFSESFSFAFVRHPFVRLASTYQNKLVDSRRKKWKKMFNRVRRNSPFFYHEHSQSIHQPSSFSPPEFLQ